MNLIIDQGNTATKLAIFEADFLQKKIAFEKSEKEKVESWIANNIPENANILISSVTDQVLSIAQPNRIYLDHHTPLPIENSYATPETLGLDRLANVVAARALNPGKNSLALDMGTCIKYDLVNSNGVYMGGNISPGLRMRYQALNHFTDKLPLFDPEEDFQYDYGTTTESSMKNGVQHAIFHEINGFIQRYEEQFGQLTIFMTGGDLKYFDKAFKNTIFADSISIEEDLTVRGLNEILKHNVEA